jgi:hypothetical protein
MQPNGTPGKKREPDWLLSMLRLLRRGCIAKALGIGRASCCRGG